MIEVKDTLELQLACGSSPSMIDYIQVGPVRTYLKEQPYQSKLALVSTMKCHSRHRVMQHNLAVILITM